MLGENMPNFAKRHRITCIEVYDSNLFYKRNVHVK